MLITMTSLKFALYLTCLCLWRKAQAANLELSSSVHQESGFISAHVGDSVTLRCFYQGDTATMFFWYKQTLGQKPRLLSTLFTPDRGTFVNEFKNDQRFTLESKQGINNLTISNLRISDSATYYCVGSSSYTFEFVESITVSVKDSSLTIPTLVHQSKSESVQPGDSVTLNCTLQTGTCDGDHSVYWFKNSEESHPGLIYTHGGRNDQCERKDNTQTHICVYNLPMKNLDLSDAGTYYCAVASCGHILFGNGTKLDVVDEASYPDTLVYFLSGALAFTTILIILMATLLYKTKKRNSSQCTAESPRVSASTTTNAEGNRDADNLHYAALNINPTNRPRRQRNNTKDDCVYSSVRQ